MIFDVTSVLAELQIPVIREGDKEIRCKCPAHAERTGNQDSVGDWSVNRDTGEHFCFSCSFGGSSVVSLAAYVLQINIAEAGRWVRERGLSDLEMVTYDDAGFEKRRSKRRALRIAEQETIDDAHLAIFDEVPDCMLHERLLDRDAVDLYEVAWSQEENAWVLPIRMPDESLLGYQLKTPTEVRNHPTGMLKSLTLFGIDKWRAERLGYLVESPLDAVRLFSAGYVGAVASFGAAVSTEQMGILVEYFDRLVVAMDNDKAGFIANNKIWQGYRQRLQLSFINYDRTQAKDVGEMSDRQIREALDGARPTPLRRV